MEPSVSRYTTFSIMAFLSMRRHNKHGLPDASVPSAL